MLARVELEGRLRAPDLEVQIGGGVGHADEGAQGEGARVERDDVGRVEDEAVVEGGGGGAEVEGRVWFGGGGVGGDGAGGDGVGVEGEVLVCGEGDGVAVDGGGGGVQVEVAGWRWWLDAVVVSEGGGGMGVGPVVCDPDDGLSAFVADEFDLILDVQNGLAEFFAGCVPDLAFHRPWVPFFSVFTLICELHPLLPVSVYRYRTVEVFLAPSFCTAMQAIEPIIRM